MKTIQNYYSNEIYDQLGYWGTWLPSNRLRLGEIGIMEDGVFRQISTLSDEGISFRESVRSGFTSHEYTSKGAVDVQTKFLGDASLPDSSLKVDESGVSIGFNRENAIYFKVDQAKTTIIENILEIEKEILRRFRSDGWQKDWVFVSEILTAKDSSVLVSNGKNAKIEFKVEGSIETPASIKLGVNHKMVYERNMAYKMIAATKTTPLFKIMGVSSNWIGKKQLTPKVIQFEESFFFKDSGDLIEIEPKHFE